MGRNGYGCKISWGLGPEVLWRQAGSGLLWERDCKWLAAGLRGRPKRPHAARLGGLRDVWGGGRESGGGKGGFDDPCQSRYPEKALGDRDAHGRRIDRKNRSQWFVWDRQHFGCPAAYPAQMEFPRCDSPYVFMASSLLRQRRSISSRRLDGEHRAPAGNRR